MEFRQYSNEVLYGATIGSVSLAANAVTTAKLNANAVTGAKNSLGLQWATYVAQTAGQGSVTVFQAGSTTASTLGTVVGFWAVNQSSAAVTVALAGTTAGTIASIAIPGTSGTGSFLGQMFGTQVLNASVASGDLVAVSTTTTSGTATCFVVLQTNS